MRFLWIVLALIGAGLLLASVSSVRQTIDRFFSADLATRDQLSSTYSLAVGLVSLLLSVTGFVLQSRTRTATSNKEPLDTTGVPVAGMGSLAVPTLDSAERVRGRNELVEDLLSLYGRRSRHPSRIQVLHGTAGGGKTTVAHQVALQAQRLDVEVWWVSAAAFTDLQTGMRLLARTLGATTQELDHEWADHAPDVVWRRLMAYPKRWLLVIDNADDTRLLAPPGEPVAHQRGWLRPLAGKQGAVMLTTRDSTTTTWGAWCQLREIPLLSSTDGAQVLCDQIQHDAGTIADAEDLSVRLGGLPLALTLAGRYLADANQLRLLGSFTTFTDYKNALDTSGLTAVFPDETDRLSVNEARQVIARTWELSLSLLADRGLPLTRTMLRLLAAFADAPIPCQQILDPKLLGESAQFGGSDAAQIRGLLHGLTSLGLIDLAVDTNAAQSGEGSASMVIRLHPLIRDASLHHLAVTQQFQVTTSLAARLLVHACSELDPENPVNWPDWQLLVPHGVHLLTAEARTSTPSPQTVVDATEAAARACQFLRHTGQFPAAQAQGTLIYNTAAPVLGPENPAVLTVRAELALLAGEGGLREHARDQLTELVSIYERVLGSEHPQTLYVRADAAAWTGRARGHRSARDQFADLLPVCQRVLGDEHPHTLTVRLHLAAWTGEAGAPEAARDQLAALLPVRQRILGAEHPDTLHTRHNLAKWTGIAGDPVGARDQFLALLHLRERVLGLEHPHTLANRARLAAWTGNAGDPWSARDQFIDLLPVRRRVLGPDHPHTLSTEAAVTEWSARCSQS